MKKYVYLVSLHVHFVDPGVNISPFRNEDFALDKPLTERETVQELEEKMVSFFKSTNVLVHKVTLLNAILLRVEGEDETKLESVEKKFITVTFRPDILEVITAGPFTTVERAANSLQNAGWGAKYGKTLTQMAYEKQPWAHVSLPNARAYIVPVP